MKKKARIFMKLLVVFAVSISTFIMDFNASGGSQQLFRFSEASAAATLYYASTDGSVRGIDLTTGAESSVLSASLFAGGNPGAAREVAFDPVTSLMWYTTASNTIRSVNVDTLAAGPQISGVPGAATGAGRHVFIDYARRKLMVPITDGSVQFYNLSDQQESGSIPANFFTDGSVGAFRHLTSDIRSGNFWYAATTGFLIEMDPDTMTRTGNTISSASLTGANPGAFRHIVVEPVNNLLLYAVTDGSVASIDLTTFQAASVTISSAIFSGADPGAGRTITLKPGPFSASISADIKANGSDGPVTVTSTGPLSVTVTMNSVMAFQNVDWWIVANVSGSWFYFDFFQQQWKAGLNVSVQGSVTNFNSIEVFNVPGMIAQLPAGQITFCSGFDIFRNGVIDTGDQQIFFNCVVVNVTQ